MVLDMGTPMELKIRITPSRQYAGLFESASAGISTREAERRTAFWPKSGVRTNVPRRIEERRIVNLHV